MEKATIYNHRSGETQQMLPDHVRWYLHNNPEWSAQAPPPPGWEREIPRYRVGAAIRPPEKARFKLEPPFVSTATDVWQYGERSYEAGEIIETTSWPHGRFQPLNYSAEKVLEYFRSAPKSSLTLTPWFNGQVRLGLPGQAPQPQPVRPAAFDMSNAR